jgi:hypothetical protein
MTCLLRWVFFVEKPKCWRLGGLKTDVNELLIAAVFCCKNPRVDCCVSHKNCKWRHNIQLLDFQNSSILRRTLTDANINAYTIFSYIYTSFVSFHPISQPLLTIILSSFSLQINFLYFILNFHILNFFSNKFSLFYFMLALIQFWSPYFEKLELLIPLF